MAGSYRHITDKDNKFLGVDYLDNLGDAYEALEECHAMIEYLTLGHKNSIFDAYNEGCLRKHNPEAADKNTTQRFWKD